LRVSDWDEAQQLAKRQRLASKDDAADARLAQERKRARRFQAMDRYEVIVTAFREQWLAAGMPHASVAQVPRKRLLRTQMLPVTHVEILGAAATYTIYGGPHKSLGFDRPLVVGPDSPALLFSLSGLAEARRRDVADSLWQRVSTCREPVFEIDRMFSDCERAGGVPERLVTKLWGALASWCSVNDVSIDLSGLSPNINEVSR
jgi:hypothetical protein